jgi:tellurite resistance protein TerC
MTFGIWSGFILLILGLLALDLGVLNRRSHVIGLRESLAWTSLWVALALLFDGLVYVMYERHWLGIGATIGQSLTGHQAAMQFLTGYLVEKSLSLDNIFVIALIFAHFRVPAAFQHRVLFWGILGALVLRGAMIAAGAALLARFDWIAYVFGAFLIATAVRMLIGHGSEPVPERQLLVRLARRLLPVAPGYAESRFTTRLDGRRALTPLFLVLLLVESSDVLFAVDSIPAVFAVTRDPFLVFTSNVFAILGLRSLYFALASVLDRFRYLKPSLVCLLAYVGVKMLIAQHYPISAATSLAVIGGILLAGILASALAGRRDGRHRRATSPAVERKPARTIGVEKGEAP